MGRLGSGLEPRALRARAAAHRVRSRRVRRRLLVLLFLPALAACLPTSGPCKADDGCAKGFLCCEGQCTDVQNDSRHCGGCGTVCEVPNGVSSCRGGSCQFQCAPGFGNCNGDRGDGCEQSLTDAVTSCGLCGRACSAVNAAPVCVASRCGLGACASGYADCNDDDLDGCEVDTRVDAAHCGACRAACSLPHASAGCAASACAVTTCEASFADCDGAPANGCEVDTRADALHCGRCGASCGPGQACVASRCRAEELIVFGGALSFATSATTNQVFRFDLVSRTFTALTPATPDGPVPSRGRHVAAWDEPRNRMVVWGGVDGTGTPVPADTWALDFGTVPPTWRKLTTTGTPPSPRFAPAAALDASSSTLYVFGGTTELGEGLSDLHALDLATGAWTRLQAGSASGAPGNRVNATGAFDPEAKVFVVFGGAFAPTRADLDELWQFDVVTKQWKAPPLTSLGGGPPARSRAAFFSGHPVHLFSGVVSLLQAPASMADDLRALDVSASPPWSLLSALGPALRFNAAHATRDGVLYLQGGGATGASGQQVFTDLWRFEPATGQWTRLHDGTGTVPVGTLAATLVAR